MARCDMSGAPRPYNARMPSACLGLLIANVAVFFLQSAGGDALLYNFALWPIGAGFAPWQLVTSAFLHGGLLHIFFNMLALQMFGADLERVWGPRRFLVYYFVCVIAAALVQTVVTTAAGSKIPTVGASGGTFGLLLAFAIYFPTRQLMLLFPPIPMPAWLFVIVYGLLELVLGVTGTQSGVAHFAHLGGMAGGYLLLKRWHGPRPR
jgi:membrane associated rhomboid family serine protease